VLPLKKVAKTVKYETVTTTSAARRPAITNHYPPAWGTAFLTAHLPEFFDRFGLNFTIDGPQLEYFVYEKHTGQDISCSLTFSFDEAAGQIQVMTFYPGLHLHPVTHYLSAVCFFMVIQHLANFHHIQRECRILLSTRQGVFDTFYALLKDFDFHIMLCGVDDQVDIGSRFLHPVFDTSMIKERALPDESIH